MTSEIIWTGSPDDQTAISGEYRLTAGEVDAEEGIYGWDMTFRGKVVAGDLDRTTERAKSAAINAMNEHLKHKDK